MVRETRLDVIKAQKTDFRLALILLSQLAVENWEEIRTRASKNFWISLKSFWLPSFKKTLVYAFTFIPAAHIPSIYV